MKLPAKNQSIQIKSIEDLLAQKQSLVDCTIKSIDFSIMNIDWKDVEIRNTTFLGCRFASLDDEFVLRKKGAVIYQPNDNLPYNPYRRNLYTWQELMEGYDPDDDNSVDYKIYKHFTGRKYTADIAEALAQRIHDHAIDDALNDLLVFDETGMTRKRCVGFMGGHSIGRNNPYYLRVAQAARLLTLDGYFIVSGGGPGVMEAANLGAYFANYSEQEMCDAIAYMSKASYYRNHDYIRLAYDMLRKYPEGAGNLAVPTWFYGHEPTNLFASHIAKYFSNSIREDGLLAISLFGVVYAPGSAGTTQEIFMDATQNHYGTFGYFSPMIFLGRERYLKETFIFPLLRQLAWGRRYETMLHITDDHLDLVDFIKKHPPVLCK